MKRTGWIAGLLVLSVHAASVDAFRGQATLTVPGVASHYQLYLPDALYRSGAGADGRDLRVFNAGGELVPFALIAPRSETHASSRWMDSPWFPLPASEGDTAAAPDAAPLAVVVAPDGTLGLRAAQPAAAGATRALLLDAHALDSPADAIELDWPEQAGDLLLTAQVSASDDLLHWRPVGEPQTLARLGQGARKVRQLRLQWPAERARYWRVAAGVALPPPSRVQLRAVASAARAWPLVWRTVAGRPLPAPKDQPWRDVLFDLGGNYPVNRLKLVLPEDNLVLPGELDYRRHEKQPWQPGVRSTWFRLLGTPPREARALELDATARYWRLRVDGRQVSLPAKPLALRVAYAPALLVYAARGAPPYRLAWGNPAPSPGDLAPAALIPGYRADRLPAFPTARIGAVQSRPAAEADEDRDARRTRYLLWTLLGLGVAALAGMVWRLSREMGQRAD